MLSSTFFSYATTHTHTYTLSLHDALPISRRKNRLAFRKPVPVLRRVVSRHHVREVQGPAPRGRPPRGRKAPPAHTNRLYRDRKSTRLNSSHLGISYAVFCLKKKNKTTISSTCQRNKEQWTACCR